MQLNVIVCMKIFCTVNLQSFYIFWRIQSEWANNNKMGFTTQKRMVLLNSITLISSYLVAFALIYNDKYWNSYAIVMIVLVFFDSSVYYTQYKTINDIRCEFKKKI